MSASEEDKLGPGSCDICHGYCEDFEIKTEIGGEGWLAGSEGCPTLNKYLRGYFIATKLLKQQFIQVAPNCSPSQPKQVDKAVKRKVGRPKNARKRSNVSNKDLGTNGPVSNGNDRLLYSTICGSCGKIVNEAVHLYQQKMELQGRIDRLAETLQKMQILADKVAREAKEAVELEKQMAHEADSKEVTQKEMLGLSLACLGQLTFPPRRSPKRNSSKKLRTQARKSYLEEEQLALEPEPQDEAEHSPHDTFYDLLEVANEQEDEHQNTGYPEMNEGDITGALTTQNDDFDYEPNEEDVSSCSNDDGDSDFEHSPKKKSKRSTSLKNETCSSSDDDNSNYGEEDANNFEIIGDEDDGKSTKLPLSKTECPKLLNSPHEDNLTTHQNRLHGYECKICSKKLFNGTSLHTHLTRIHKKKLQFNCPDCHQFFSQKGQLLFHRSQEHNVKQYILPRLPNRDPQNEEEEKWAKIQCGECGKVCLTGELLDDHLRRKHEMKIPREERWAVRKWCHFCTKRFYLEQRYFVHVKVEHPEKTEEEFRCDQCNIGFSTTTQLKQHFEQSHDALVERDSIHNCDQCEWPFLDQSSLKTHSRVHNQVKTKKPVKILPRNELFATLPFKCWFCWEAFPQKDKLKRHLKNNTRHKTLKVEFPCDVESCEYYNKPFEKLEELNKHLKSCHGDSDEILECQWCSWGFTSKNMLDLHKLNHLSPTNTYHYNCPLCDRICKKKVTLINHYNMAHELNLKPNKCPYCPERSISLKALEVHVKEEHRDLLDIAKMLTCDQCGKNCSNAKSLDAHIRCYHRDHTCSICSKVFKTYDLVRKHVRNDHDVKPRHLCSLCGTAYSSAYTLRVHMEEVHKKPKFECQICHVKLKNKANLKYHMKSVHDPTKLQGPPAPFICKDCGKGYSKKDSLDDHVRVKHSQDNWRVYTCHQCGKRFQRERTLIDHLSGKGCPKRVGAPVIIS